MTASELRIGNLLQWGVHYCDVKSFTRSDIGEVNIYTSKTIGAIGVEDFKPIPLTEEWLIENTNGYIFNGWDDMKFWRFDTFNYNMFELEVMVDGLYCGANKIEFVHELQNCYFYHNNNKKELIIK